MDIKSALSSIVEGKNISEKEATDVMNQIMNGDATSAQTAAYLVALRMKGETIEEITGSARVMREKAVCIDAGRGPVVDTCGTGGDQSGTFNISTTAAFVAAGAGAVVAKHGNRAVSSSTGSADVLKELGVNIEADQKKVELCIAEAGIGFLFAPLLHGAMKHAIGPRKEMGIRTIFNILGPLTNPAGAKAQVVGLFDKNLLGDIAKVLGNLGSERVYVVHGEDGLDELTVTGKSYCAFLDDGKVVEMEIEPEDFGLGRYDAKDLKGGDSKTNAYIIKSILEGKTKGAGHDIAVLNAGAAIHAVGLADDLYAGVAMAKESIKSGLALRKLNHLVEISNS